MSDDCHHHVCTGRNLRTELVDVHQHLKEVEPAVLVVLVEGAHVGRRYANCQRKTPRASCLLLCLRVRAIGIQACMRLRPQWARLCVCCRGCTGLGQIRPAPTEQKGRSVICLPS